MGRSRPYPERHAITRLGWLRAAVLGANDGIVSTASLIVGIAASGSGKPGVLLAGAAALAAGAMSMAAGEYVSVSSQSDTEKADLVKEARELADQPESEREELASIYVQRGLERGLAIEVAKQLMAKDALAAHARDELGLFDALKARPLQAAVTSAITFSLGAAAPLLVVPLARPASLVATVALVSLMCLAALGALGAIAGGAPLGRSILRVTFWGAMAMILTAGVGRLVGAVV